jgi:hypothetical protein
VTGSVVSSVAQWGQARLRLTQVLVGGTQFLEGDGRAPVPCLLLAGGLVCHLCKPLLE